MFDGSLPEIAALSTLSDVELVAASAGWGRVESAAAARKLAAMAEVFRRRTGIDEALDRKRWFVDPEASVVSELAAAHNITDSLAMFQTHRAVMLGDRLPTVAALFERGLISDLLVRTIVARTALITDPTTMAAVDAALAEQITRWGPKSAKKTRTSIDALVEIHDPGALRRTKTADQDRDVEFGLMGDDAGFMTVWARMYAPDGVAFEQRVNDMAHSVCPDDPRTAKERRNDALAAVATGTQMHCECDNPDCPAGGEERPTKDIIIHVIASDDALTDEAAEADPADAAADSDARPDTDVQPGGERTDTPAQEDVTAECRPVQTEPVTTAPAYVIGGGVIDATVLAAFLDRAKLRQLKHPGNASPEPRYRPSTALDDFVRCRDLTCRFPGCDKPAYLTDIDHTVPYPAGPTCASNLKCLCRKHHLLKTFWTGENGWRDEQLPDGTIIWTAPTGQTYTTQPGSALLFPTLCIPTAPIPKITATVNTPNSGLKMPKRSRTRAKDRAYRIDIERRLNDELVAERNKPPPF
ncbi:HNH endonuclease signature motif containing protein [Mycolicibacterium baixiangningiae]|uniref:HNH endonuclease signature motif containing protein n=1 Tax=Mycolicibacterium baixiangningiae TaxID=2761578 RepID=UPI0018D0334C|nr:HNH endonuclease signature motif containing protein [Mycolicibacterium baixiangningiae]